MEEKEHRKAIDSDLARSIGVKSVFGILVPADDCVNNLELNTRNNQASILFK
jgi:hypothetical protein